VLCRRRQAVPITNDHSPTRPDELRRIEERGGTVENFDVFQTFFKKNVHFELIIYV